MISAYDGKPGEGMQYRNRAQWLAIGGFLARQNLREVLERQCAAEASKRSAVAAAAPGASQILRSFNALKPARSLCSMNLCSLC